MKRTDSIDYYKKFLNEAAALPRLSRADEFALSEKVKAGVDAEKRLSEFVTRHVECDRSTLRRLQREAERGKEAQWKLVTHNLLLAAHYAKRYYAESLEREDLASYAMLGLVEAARGFDATKGAYSAYAKWFIHKAILEALEHDHLIAVPLDEVKALGRLARAIDAHEASYGVKPSADELARAIGASKQRVLELLELRGREHRPLSFEGWSYDDDAPKLAEMIAAPELQLDCACRDKEARVDESLSVLTDREREAYVIARAYADSPQMGYSDVGAEMGGISRQRVQQLLRSADAKLQAHVTELESKQGRKRVA